MWLGGLRGAMAYALSLDSLEYDSEGQVVEYSGVILAMVLIYSLFTLIFVSSSLYPIMKRCDITREAAGQRLNQLKEF